MVRVCCCPPPPPPPQKKSHVLSFKTVVGSLQVSHRQGLRANSSVPYSVILYVVDSVDKMIGATVEFCTNGCIQMLQDASVSDDVLTRVRCNLQRQSDTLNRPLNFFVNSVQAR